MRAIASKTASFGFSASVMALLLILCNAAATVAADVSLPKSLLQPRSGAVVDVATPLRSLTVQPIYSAHQEALRARGLHSEAGPAPEIELHFEAYGKAFDARLELHSDFWADDAEVRVNGASGLETFDHVAADEAAIVLELATGAMARAESAPRLA